MGWEIRDVNTAPPRLAAVYFIYLPVKDKCLYSNEINKYQIPSENYGDPSQLQGTYPNAPLIPIDPHLALSLGWIELDKMVGEMPYVTDILKACLKLVKDVKEEAHGNDKEGL